VAMAARVSEVTAAAREAPAIGAVMARTSFCYTGRRETTLLRCFTQLRKTAIVDVEVRTKIVLP
jgi:hypothetical protein